MEYRCFLLAEVVGARLAWEDRPDQVPGWLGSVSTAFRESILAHNGVEFALTGEQLGAAFDSSGAALAAAVDAQRRLLNLAWSGSDELSVRMAIHDGQAHLLDGRFMGPALTLSLDLLKAARGGQILISSSVASAVGQALPGDATLRDRGTMWLIEASTTEHVYDVVHPDLPSNFPIGQPIGSRDSNLDLYIPRDRRIALALGQALPDRTSGAVLFADVSKYSSLTEALLEKLGPQRGAEELTRRLNTVLSTVVREVHRYGGSVIGFAGDGVTCWFDGDNGRRATAAALASQETLMHAPNEELSEPTPPRVKIVVTSGLARRFLVGVPRIQRFDVLAGGILDRMAAAERLARPGDVLIGSGIVGWIRDQIEVVDWRSEASPESKDSPQLDSESFAVVTGISTNVAQPVEQIAVPALPEEVARAWINPVLFQRIARGEGDLVSELRQAEALFVRFSGIQYDFDNDAGTKLSNYIEWVQKTLIPLGGFVMQVVVGDKGSYLYSVFGAPVSLEDDALRALRAAEKLMDVPASLDFITDTAAGISQGKMHAGVFGRSSHKTYEVLGHAANVAAALMQGAGPGRILVSPEIAEAGKSHYQFRPGGSEQSFEVTGHERTAPALLPKGMVHADIVGRTEERRRLRAYLDGLLEGRSQMVVIQGPAGIGKSRLLIELMEQAEALAIPTFAGSGNAIDARIPLHVWKDIFAAVLGVQANDDEQALQLALERHLANAPQLLELAPLLNPVLPIPLPENDLTARIPPEARSDNALNVMSGLLLRPVGPLGVMLIIIDDAQWLDSASWTLVEAVLRQHPSVLLAVATRPPERSEAGDSTLKLPGPIQAFMDGKPDALLIIEPLGDDDVVELIKQYIGVRDVPPELSSVIVERAEGNPFFAQELAGTLVQRGLIAVEDGICRLLGKPEQMAAAFPERVEKLLISRLDHLPADHRTTLLVASVLGRSFSLRMLADVHPSRLDHTTLRAQLNDLSGFGLLALERELPELSYRFRHGLTHQAAGELLPSKLRGEIQAEAASWIEANQAANLAQYYPTLARYWDAAGEVSKSLEFLELAAENAWAAGAYLEAISFYTRAIDLARDGHHVPKETIAVWQLRLGEICVHHQSEDVTKGRENLEAGLSTLGIAPPQSAIGLGLGVVWQLLVQLWYRLRTTKGQPASSSDRLLEASRAYERLVEVYYISGENLPSLYGSLRALNLAEAAGPSPELTRGWATAGAIFGFVPLRSLASRYLQRALRAAESGDPAAAAWAALVAGFYYSGVAEWDNAQALMEEVVAISGQVGDGRRLEDGLSNLMIQSYLRGDISRGLQLTEDLRARAVARHADRPLAYYLAGRAYFLLELGRPDEARQVIDQLEDVQSRDQHSADQALINDTYGLMALAELRRGNLRKALTAAEMLLTRVSRQPPSNYSTIAAYAAPAEVYAEAWRLSPSDRDMERQMKRALSKLKSYARVFPIGRPRLLLWQGVFDELRGRPSLAIRKLELSLAEAVKMEMRLDEMRTLRELARLLGDSDPTARDYRARAERILAEARVGSATSAA
ncbi:MAG TPA: AAA family ATPase [Acidimicrobiia bacterium]|nr:AAA family ATPase [Acidimicrobiia bacterium]